jgi:hypothetical protein
MIGMISLLRLGHCRGGILLGGYSGTLNLGGGRRRLNFRCGGIVVASGHGGAKHGCAHQSNKTLLGEFVLHDFSYESLLK